MRKRDTSTSGLEKTHENEVLLHDISNRLLCAAVDFPRDHVPNAGSEHFLPIDEVLKKLASRKRPPKLRSKSEGSHFARLIWKYHSPNSLVRHHLHVAFGCVGSQLNDQKISKVQEVRRFLANCSSLRMELGNFTKDELIFFPYIASIMQKITREERRFRIKFAVELFDSLANLDSFLDNMELWAESYYDDISPPQGGKPKVEWRHDFVFRMAHLWFLLTGKKAPAGPNTVFMEFLEAAWASGGDELPQVSWESTVRYVNSNTTVEDDKT